MRIRKREAATNAAVRSRARSSRACRRSSPPAPRAPRPRAWQRRGKHQVRREVLIGLGAAGVLAFIASRAFASSAELEDAGTVDAPGALDIFQNTIDAFGAGDMTPNEQRNMSAFLA